MINTKSQFYLEDVIELIATKTSFIEDSIDVLYKYIQKLMKKFYTQQQAALKDGTMGLISSLIINLIKDLKYFSKSKIRSLIGEKLSYFKKIIDIICLFHNMYEYLTIVPHPEFQDKSPKRALFIIENSCIKIPGLVNCFLDLDKMEKLKEFYKYIIYKILNQKKEGIKQLEIDEFSYFLILYRIFANFINFFCFNYSFKNNCTILESINIFKNNGHPVRISPSPAWAGLCACASGCPSPHSARRPGQSSAPAGDGPRPCWSVRRMRCHRSFSERRWRPQDLTLNQREGPSGSCRP